MPIIPVSDFYSSPSGGSVAGGRFVYGNPLAWSTVSDFTFSSGSSSAKPVYEFLPNGGSAGQIQFEYVGTLPSGVTFNQQNAEFVYSGSGGGQGNGYLVARTIPCFVTISFTPTEGTFPTAYYDNLMQDEYPWQFSHQFKDGQVLPGTSVYCLSVKNGRMYESTGVSRYEKFRVDPIDYWPSGCLKNATLSGQFMAVWKNRNLWISPNMIQLIAVPQTVVYGDSPVNPLSGDVVVLYESSEQSISNASNNFVVRIV